MSNETTNTAVPKLRFPEFQGTAEWETELFEEIYSFKGTNSLSRDKLNYEGGAVKNIHYGDIHTKFSTLFDITKEKVPFVNASVALDRIREENYCIEGDIILADASEDMNDIGKSIEVVNLNGEKVLSGLHTQFARQKAQKLVIGFAGHLFKSGVVRAQIQNEAQGTKVLGISAGRLSKIEICYPGDKAEQQKIAAALSSLDDLLTAQSAKLAALQAHKRGLMQGMFPAEGETVPKLRFPEFQGAGEWEEKSFDQLFTIGSGRDYKHLSKGSIPMYGSGGYMLSVNDYLYDGESACIGRKGTIDKPMFLTGKFWTVDTLFYTHSFQGCLPKFVFLLFQNIPWAKHNEAGGVPSLSKTIINKLTARIPSLEEQQKIADCFSSLDERITAQTQQIEALKLHKKGLMQGLFPTA